MANTIRASDGLHPLSSEALAKMEKVIRDSQHPMALQQPPHQHPYMHQHNLKRSYSTVEHSEYDQTLLASSAGRGMSGTAERLQQQDSFVTTRNPLNGETILHLAARLNVGERAIRRLGGIMVADDSPNSAEKTLALLCLDKDGRSPLTASAATDGLETTTALFRLEREAISCNRSATSAQAAPPTSTAESTGGTLTERPLMEARRRTRHVESRRSTPLIVSQKAGCTEVTKRLLDEGCSIQGVDETGRNLVHWAAALNAATLLTRISHTKGFSRMLEARDDYDRTPLMLAVRENSLEVAQILLEHRAEIDVSDCTDSSPLSEAEARGFSRMHALLLEYKQRRRPSTTGGSGSRHHAKNECPGDGSPSTSNNSDEEATESEIDTIRGAGDNATSSTQYTPQHYQNSQISPQTDVPTTASTTGTESWHQHTFCNETVKPDPSVCSSGSGIMKQEDHVSPQTPSTSSSIKEISPPVATTHYWQQNHQQQVQQPQGSYLENYHAYSEGEPRFPAPFPGTNGYEQNQHVYQRKYQEQQHQQSLTQLQQQQIAAQHQQSQQHTQLLQQQQQHQQPQVQQNGLCPTQRNSRAPVYIAGSQPSSRGMFAVQL